jgi:hypothetical protein
VYPRGRELCSFMEANLPQGQSQHKLNLRLGLVG